MISALSVEILHPSRPGNQPRDLESDHREDDNIAEITLYELIKTGVQTILQSCDFLHRGQSHHVSHAS